MRSSFLIVVALVSSVNAGKAQMAIGPVTLQFGQTQASVIRQLGAAFRVDSASGSYIAVSRDGPPFAIHGNVGFRDGRLAFVSRNWGTGQRDAHAAIRAVVGALGTLEGGTDNCRVSKSERVVPEGEVRSVVVECGLHSTTVIVARYLGDESYTVQETWRDRAAP